MCLFIKFVLYSCIDDSGERNFDMTQASKNLAFDSHNDNNLLNFDFCSLLATGKKKNYNEILGILKIETKKKMTYLFQHYKTLE